MKQPTIDLPMIKRAADSIKGTACVTPLKKSIKLSKLLNKNIYLKLETMQHTGSFKLRGAANIILNLNEHRNEASVVTASSGNHGRAVAYVANELKIPAVICMTELVPKYKIDGIKELGAEIVIFGDNQDLATEKALEIAKQRKMSFISAFDDPYVIAGQGTIGLEILVERPEIDTIVVQLSGGGLASGIAIAAKAIKPSVKIIGVTLQYGAAMYESIKAGEIIIAMEHALKQEKLVLEGGGAACIAMLLHYKNIHFGANVAVICSGDNIDVDKLLDLL